MPRIEFLLAEARARLFEVGGRAKGPLWMPLLRLHSCMGRLLREATSYLAENFSNYDLAIWQVRLPRPWKKEVIGTQKWISPLQ